MKNSETLKLDYAPIRLVINPFDVRARLAEGHACGGWDEKFRAAVTLECENLDKHGFVVENMTVIKTIRKFFKGRKYVASCEQLCQCIAHICHDLVGERLTCAEVKVYNLTGHLEIKWCKGEAIPPLPFCVTKKK
jgi:hypothetical protein